MAKKLANRKSNDTSSLFSDTVQALAEGITGIADSSRAELVVSAGTIFQRLRAGTFLSLLRDEWDHFRDKGRVRENYEHSEQHMACLGELFAFLDNDTPDEVRFSVIKQIFLVAAEEKLSTRSDVMPHQYLRIARTLSTGEILILNACYAAAGKDFWKPDDKAIDWHQHVADATGLHPNALIEIHVKTLEEKSLLIPPRHSDRSGIVFKPYFRLTELGYRLCEFINAYEPET